MSSFRFGGEVHRFGETASTQELALAAAAAGAGEGTLFLAESQTRGRGRHGHAWSSPPGAGLYASLVLRPRRPAAELPVLTLAAGLAVADAVRMVAGVEPELRWPNDLLLQGRKFCGLLLEAATGGEGPVPGQAQHRLGAVGPPSRCEPSGMWGEAPQGPAPINAAALGFGINLRHQEWPPELAPIATALDDHAAQPVLSDALCDAVLRQLERRYAAWSTGDGPALLREFEARAPAVRGCEVAVGASDGAAAAYRGRTEGLEPSGFLRVRLPGGELRVVVSGDVRPV
ncbi:MAG: biotin--[acetyl-CoA-carboxylase] ligase [Terriglobales bacterium]